MRIEKLFWISRSSKRRAGLLLRSFIGTALLFLAGCQKTLKTEDPQLKPIQEMLDARLPVGSPDASVTAFLSARGYAYEPGEKRGTIVAVIRHIDTERLQPVTARVMFYFDANGKLNTFELQRTRNEPIPQ